MMQELEARGAFGGEAPTVSSRLMKEDLVNVLRMSQTVKYVSALIEYANQSSEEALYDEEGTLSPNLKAEIRRATERVKGAESAFASELRVEDLMATYSNVKGVQTDAWLKRQRETLVRLYEADPTQVADLIGWQDPSAEPRRRELREKIKDRWSQHVGMRRAFPSYQLLIVGPVGEGGFYAMEEAYAWTAVRSVEIVEEAKAAGSFARLELSNMRGRLSAPAQEGPDVRMMRQASGFEDRLELDVGTHMQVGLGYGPDWTGMKPFAGRVTALQGGPVTRIELSSYGATLQNPPASGEGFTVDGRSGQHTLAEAILYTISSTEGLGRDTRMISDLQTSHDALDGRLTTAEGEVSNLTDGPG